MPTPNPTDANRHCPACGAELGAADSSTCPQCGAAVGPPGEPLSASDFKAISRRSRR
jgi:predicted amidophosphoribosyltransferase